ncbi:MAG: hypothetical protein IPI35_24230 [Deltaproteobacteria bacterium]|nr:hypothetical protein [Deltaproteobacteria bacterium]
MRFISLTVLALTAASCSGGDKEVVDTQPPCGVEIDETIPAAGATNFYYRGEIEFYLSDADETATLSIDGVTGTSYRNEDNDVVYFKPDAPLSPSTAYTAKLTYCTGEAEVGFTTSALGTSIADTSSLIGKVYSLDLQAGRVVIPEGVGSVLEQYLDIVIFMEVASADASAIRLFGALADEANPSQQDYCSQTLAFPEADFSGAPFFEIGPESTNIAVAGFEVTIDDLLISGTFAGDGSYWGGGVLQGSVDTRALVPLIEEGGEDSAVCDIVAGFGVACEVCSSDGQPFCLSIKAVDLGGEEITSTDLEEIAMSDCHENCPDSAENPECML